MEGWRRCGRACGGAHLTRTWLPLVHSTTTRGSEYQGLSTGALRCVTPRHGGCAQHLPPVTGATRTSPYSEWRHTCCRVTHCQRMPQCMHARTYRTAVCGVATHARRSVHPPFPCVPPTATHHAPAPHPHCGTHSSFVRYTRNVEGSDGAAAAEAFARAVAAGWPSPVDVPVTSVSLVIEDVPYMHVPRDAAHLPLEFTLPLAGAPLAAPPPPPTPDSEPGRSLPA